jgi:PIN domain nuclease of toxin-antitoxin system
MRRRRQSGFGVKFLLDTNVVLWRFAGDPIIPGRIAALIDNPANTILVSAASAWEICTKVRIGKLPSGRALCDDFCGYLQRNHFEPLAITVEHGRLAGRMAGVHKDPFDRMLAAQAVIENLPIVSNDALFASFGVTVEW